MINEVNNQIMEPNQYFQEKKTYLLKNPLYVYQIPFLLKTRKNILKYIKKNIEKLNSTLKENKSNKNKIDFVLNYFITLDYYSKCSLKKVNESVNSKESSFSRNNDSQYNYNYNEMNNSSSVSNPFSRDSYKQEKEKPGLGMGEDQFEEPEILDYNNIKNIWKNEQAFQILDESSFSFHTNKKGSQPSIIFDEITFANEKSNISFDEIIKITSENKILNENYKNFIKVLETIINRIKNKFSFQYKLKITLNFKTNAFEYSQFKIECNYNVEIPFEKPFDYKDENILKNGLTSGFPYLLNEINNEVYNDLEYED